MERIESLKAEKRRKATQNNNAAKAVVANFPPQDEGKNRDIVAAKELGMTLVPIKIDDDLQDENSKLRALISNNFGRRKNDPAKDRKALEIYVSLKGYKPGEIGKNHFQKDQNGLSEKSTLDEIAKELNISKTNLKRALRIERNLTDSMKELLFQIHLS